jgi:hypothetical protein
MIKMKNILAENLLKFGVKNLSESDKTKLQEAYTLPNGLNESRRRYLMENDADIKKQIEVAFNQILTTLKTITMVPGTTNPVTFGNLVKDMSNTDPNRIPYTIKISVGGPRPEEFTITVGGSMLNVSDPSKLLSAWQNYLIGDFTNGVNNVQTNSKNWIPLKNAILFKLNSVKLATPTAPR